AGQWSLLRQFCSGLTNHRTDRHGADRGLLVAEVLRAVREAGGETVLGLRLSCDELAPWAGIVPEAGAGLARRACELDAGVPDYVTVVRGSAYGTGATRPDAHSEPGFNLVAADLVRRQLPPAVAVVAQGSIVDVSQAADAVASGVADLVEMTRAQIADAGLARKVARGQASRIRPCVLCNQACQVRDVRNPIVSCIGDPRSGHELDDPPAGRPTFWTAQAAPRSQPSTPAQEATPAAAGTGVAREPSHLLVVGAGPAGLECARVAAASGIEVTVLESRPGTGGMLRAAAAKVPGRERLGRLADWLERECRRLGVEIVTDHEAGLEELDSYDGPIVCATGSRPGRRSYHVAMSASVVTAAEVLAAEPSPGRVTFPRGNALSPTVVFDPIGGPIGIGVAELLAASGCEVTLVTPDFVVGEQLGRSGDLAPANVRLQRLGVRLIRSGLVRAVEPDHVLVESRWSGVSQSVPAVLLVDAGHRMADDSLARSLAAPRPGRVQVIGDAVAPRSVLEAVLEGRRAAAAVAATRPPAPALA
ncbi:MAG: NAD-binding protein, partial [Acidimicrobiales bacterium]